MSMPHVTEYRAHAVQNDTETSAPARRARDLLALLRWAQQEGPGRWHVRDDRGRLIAAVGDAVGRRG